MIKNLKIGVKQLFGFSTIILLLIVVGAVGYGGIETINKNLQEIVKTAPLVDAAMEMKIAVARDMQMIMEMLAAQDKAELDGIWKEHEGFIKEFDTYAGAIVEGAETEEGMIYATDSEEMRQIVHVAEAYQDKEFQPRVQQIFDLITVKLSGKTIDENMLNQLDEEADGVGEKMLEVLGGVEGRAKRLIKQAQEHAKSSTSKASSTLLIASVLGVVLGLIFSFFMTRAIAGPIKKAVGFVEKLSHGDFTQDIELDQNDEIGSMVKALNEMKRSLKAMIENIGSQVESLTSSSSELSTISNQMSQGAEQTSGKSNAVATAAEEMSSNMNTVAAASEQASTNVNMVAAATEQMTATVNEIAQNSEKARSITNQAVEQAQSASVWVNELGKAADEISKVTEVITEISEQTNLLALNATIEAARAGEAGKGFAVVANEIKDLASQTAQATQEIKAKIDSIQGSTSSTVTEIEDILKVINQMNDIVSTIATAVEEQSATTSEIAGNVSQASTGIVEVNQNVTQSSTVTAEIARDIEGVNQAAQEMATGSNQVNLSAIELSNMAEQLNGMVTQFKI